MLNRYMSVILFMLLVSQCRAFPLDSLKVSSAMLDSSLGNVTIKSRPSESRVFINNSFRGVTPLQLTLPAGKYTLSLQKEGRESSTQPIKVLGAQNCSVDDTLYAIPEFKITTLPANATIYIDSSFAGRSPVKDLQISSGRHLLRACLDGYEDLSLNVTLRPGENSFVNLALVPKFGFLTMNVSPSDAEVFIDSMRLGCDRMSKLKIPSGMHQLKVFHPSVNNTIQEPIYIAPRVESEVTAPLDHFSAKAALMSAVLPGLGQFLDGSYLKGSLEFLSAAAMGYLISSSYDFRRQKKVEQDLAYLNYQLAVGEMETFAARERLTRTNSDLRSATNKLTMSIAALGAVYGLTIIDALIFNSKERSFYIKRTVLPYQGLEKYGSLENVELGVNLHF